MKHAFRAAFFALALLMPAGAGAQCLFPTGLPANTVVGRLGIIPGPCQAITFQTLAQLLAATAVATTPATTLRGNPTASTATPTDFTIQGLVNKPVPSASNDLLLLYDATAGAFKNVTPSQVAATAAANVPLGRLTLASGIPVMTATSCGGGQCAAQQTLYFAPDGSSTIPIYNGTIMLPFTFTSSPTDTVGLSLSMAASANWAAASCFDVFYAYVSGTLYFGTGPAWTTCAGASAARGYSLAKYNGVPVNAATMTLRYGASSTISVPANQATYLGTIATDAGSAGKVTFQFGTAAAGGGQAIHNVWNYWDRKLVTTDVNGANAATFSSQIAAGYKACFDSATYRVTFLSGLADDAQFFSQNFYGGATNNTGANGATTAAGFIMDSYANPLLATTLDLYVNNENYSTNSSSSPHALFGTYTYQPRIGQHFVQCFVGNDGSGSNSTFQTGGGVGDLQMQFRM